MRYNSLLNRDGLNVLRLEFKTKRAGTEKLVWLDVECEKVLAPPNWPYKTRTSAFMVGLGYYVEDMLVIEVVTGDELAVMEYVSVVCEGATVVYTATRSYDRLVVEGRWTYYRRSPSDVPGNWPSAQGLNWENIYGGIYYRPTYLVRGIDCPSKEVPRLWTVNPDLVVLHNVRDVLQMVMGDSRSELPTFDSRLIEGTVEEALEVLETHLA